jgi:hypothetical protein
MMDDRMQKVSDIACCYIDDILIGTEAKEGEDLIAAHDRDVRRVLNLLKEEVLICDIGKCKFFLNEVEFCGHILKNGTREPAPGKLMAVEKWPVPKTIHELRAFLGFTNHYNVYIKEYSKLAAVLQDKLKVPRDIGKKGSRAKISWTGEDQEAFDALKASLLTELALQRVNPDKPFVLRVDASNYAVGATLEQLVDEKRLPTIEDVRAGRTVPVAFMSRKLASNQRNWVPREQETYAIILALLKWESWIGFQPILVLTDHQAIEYWAKELLETPSGPTGRRLRWHQIFSRFDLTIGYIPGKENTIADILSRWAYPASQAFREVSKNGTKEDDDEMKEIIRHEKEEEKLCMWVKLRDPPLDESKWIRGVIRTIEPVGAGEDRSPSTAPPLRFEFKSQREEREGKLPSTKQAKGKILRGKKSTAAPGTSSTSGRVDYTPPVMDEAHEHTPPSQHEPEISPQSLHYPPSPESGSEPEPEEEPGPEVEPQLQQPLNRPPSEDAPADVPEDAPPTAIHDKEWGVVS